MPAGALMAELYGKATGCSRGRGGSMHFFDVSRRFYGGYAIVAGGLPIATGLALAEKMQGRAGVVACFFGDGAVDEGEFSESLNLAALWGLPIVFVCENNLYAMGTALARHQAQTDIRLKAEGHGVPAETADGMDVRAVEAAMRRAVDGVRRAGGPRFLEARAYRFRAHSMADPELYRTKEEVERWKQQDPIATFVARLQRDALLTDADLAALTAAVETEIDAAVGVAETGPWEPVEDLTRDVYTP
jgi:TPP-dependent pyruvate/acetoin dehydrogenase alpha subunit